MNHMLSRPQPPLERLVDFFWAADNYVARAPRERVLPSGSQTLVFLLGEPRVETYPSDDAAALVQTSGAILCGTRQTPLIIGTALGPTVGVHFKAAGARRFFDVPAEAVAEKVVSLEALWGSAARALRERLQQTPTQRGRVRLLESELLQRARSSFEMDPSLRLALEAFEAPELTSVAEVNRRTGLSPKRLLALFGDEVGLSPKAFWRVRRFRAALRDLEQGVGGAALAHQRGYFDQAHFLREFRTLAGSSPRQYFESRVIGTDHVSVYR